MVIRKPTRRELRARQSLLPQSFPDLPREPTGRGTTEEEKFTVELPEPKPVSDEVQERIRQREKQISRLKEAGVSVKQAEELASLEPRKTRRTPEEVNRNILRFTQAARAQGLFTGAESTEEIKDLFDTIGETPLFQSIQEGLVKLDKIGAATPNELRNTLLRRETIKGEIKAEVDTKMVELGFGSTIFKYATGTVGKVAGGVIIGAILQKPISVLVDFDRKAENFNSAIPDIREGTTLVTSEVQLGAISVEEGIARLDEMDEKVNALEYSIRLAARKSATIKATGRAEAIISRLDKYKSQSRRERARLFILQQQAVFPEATEEELVAFLRKLQRER